MTEIERKLMSLTAEQSRALAEAMNAGYNKRLAEYEHTDNKEKTKSDNEKPEQNDNKGE